VLVWHPISQICCVKIGPSVDIEHDIMSKSGAGGAGGVFFLLFCLKSLGMATLGIRLFERFL